MVEPARSGKEKGDGDESWGMGNRRSYWARTSLRPSARSCRSFEFSQPQSEASVQLGMLADGLGFQDETSIRDNLVLHLQSFQHQVKPACCGTKPNLAQCETSVIVFDRNKHEPPFADRLHGRFRHDWTRRAGRRELDIRVHVDA